MYDYPCILIFTPIPNLNKKIKVKIHRLSKDTFGEYKISLAKTPGKCKKNFKDSHHIISNQFKFYFHKKYDKTRKQI